MPGVFSQATLDALQTNAYLNDTFVDVEVRTSVLKFKSGRDFFEDPVTRLLLLPEFRINLGIGDLEAPLKYVRDAIDKYWSEGTFELTINVGCASGRRLG